VCDGGAVDRVFVGVFLNAYETPPAVIVLDLDATDDPLHGEQEGRFFHGYSGCSCYLPLSIFAGNHLLLAWLRSASLDASAGALAELLRIVAQIRDRWPQLRIIVRGDSDFAHDAIMSWCESSRVRNVFGLARNPQLCVAIERQLVTSRRRCQQRKHASRRDRDFRCRTLESWDRSRRVVGKAEHLPQGANPRFVVTS